VPPAGTPSASCARADHVDGLLSRATAAGGRLVKPAKRALWGGYSGHVADPDGHIWKVASSNGPPRLRPRTASAVTAPTEPIEVPVVIGVADVRQAKAFYEALGSPAGKSYSGKYVSFSFAGASDLALYQRGDLADDADGRGFRAVTFSHIVDSADEVDEVIDRPRRPAPPW
jgi:predicted lactoylglutathione lyase